MISRCYDIPEMAKASTVVDQKTSKPPEVTHEVNVNIEKL